MTQQELAERAGLSVRGISDIERGLRPSPHGDTAERLAQALALDPEQQAELLAERMPRIAAGAAGRRPDLGQSDGRSVRARWTASPLTSFIGRQPQIDELAQLIETRRLITLTGPGGIGKTRLAMQVAATVQQREAHEVTIVELSDLTAPQHVAQAVALALGQPEQVGRPIEVALVERLQSADTLLVLDNCEHLLGACASLANGLLQQCPSLRILATSREPMTIGGEAIYRVWPLPDDDAVHLLVERARSVSQSFVATDSNAASLAQLCRRLDGIPLAIELAAAWVQLLSIEEISDRLDSALGLLVVGNRVGPQRQQTLRATLDWSYALLSDREQRVFRRLSVFAGGWTVEAAESVGAGDSIDPAEVLQLLARLVNASLVVADRSNNGASRYRMLEVVRQYAHERLLTQNELEATRRRHARFFVLFAERIVPKLHQGDQLLWIGTLEQDHDNCRAALNYFGEHQNGVDGLRLAGVLAGFWLRRGYVREGREWLELTLQAGREAPAPVRMVALRGAGSLAAYDHDFVSARAVQSEGLALARALDDQRSIAASLNSLGYTELSEGDHAAADKLLTGGLELFRTLEDAAGISLCLFGLANLAATRGELTQAATLFAESLSGARPVGDSWRIASCLHGLGHLAWRSGEKHRAWTLLSESLALTAELRDQRGTAVALESMALVIGDKRPDLGARMFGVASALRSDSGARRRGWLDSDYARGVERARTALGDAGFDAAWAAGRGRPVEEAIAEALALQAAELQGRADPLTPRERQVAQLVERGLTNRQIGDMLVITEGTAALHVKNALSKLGFKSRAQLAVWNAQQAQLSIR